MHLLKKKKKSQILNFKIQYKQTRIVEPFLSLTTDIASF